MATIALDHNVKNINAPKVLDSILSSGIFKKKKKKSGIEKAFEDIKKGRITRIYTPKNWVSEK